MPKHSRAPSASQHRYNAVPLAPSANAADMYNARLSMPTYYDVQATPTLHLQTDQQQQYDAYLNGDHDAVAVQTPMPQARAPSSAWSKEDDETLIRARASGNNWGQIQQRFFSSKTPNACRKRHERLMERRTADSWNQSDFEKLSMEYMRMRKEIWGPLAAKVGEKWNVVEQKCMSNGLKNLQSAARSGARRERLGPAPQLQGYDDDSGISGMGLTPVDGLDPSYSSPETTASGGGHSSNASGGYHHHQMSAHTQLQALGHSGHHHYGYATPGSTPHHGYTSSVSSNGTSAGAYGNAAAHGHGHPGSEAAYMAHEQGMRAQRLSSADMGIEAIMNRTAPTRVEHQGM